MEQRQIIRRDPVVMAPLADEKHSAHDPYLPQGQSGKWRSLRFRLGSLHFSYTSMRADPPRLRFEDRARADAMPRYLPTRRHEKPHFYGRFIDHLGITASALIFLSGAVFVAAMQSNAVVVRGSEAPGQSLETSIVDQTTFPIANANPAITQDRATSVTIEKPIEPPVETAAPVAHKRIPAPTKTTTPQAVHSEHPSRASSKTPASLNSGPLERVPVISAAIDRAFNSGELQSWQLGTAEGVVVVGDPVDVSGQTCRIGSILARQMGEQARTQAFRLCRPT
tara:strand:+ start:115788 stop:116630 length:843 start_codon:yes stop_codon:yes gene_type:complete